VTLIPKSSGRKFKKQSPMQSCLQACDRYFRRHYEVEREKKLAISKGIIGKKFETDYWIDSTFTTSGTLLLMWASMPCFKVKADMGHPTQ
jgi:hypothetical protein